VRRVNRRLVILTEIIAPYRIPVFNALAQLEGIELHVIFLAETDPGFHDWLVYKEEIFFSHQVLPSHRWRWQRNNVLVNRGVNAALRKASPEIILCGGYGYLASWQALLWARRNRVPFLLWAESTARDLRANNRLIEFLKDKFMGKCDGFVVPGKSSQKYLESFGISPQRIFTAPNAVDNDLFGRAADNFRGNGAKCRAELKLPPRFFLFVGRLTVDKGVFDLLRSYGTLSPELRARVGLVFAGDGPARAELERRSENLTPGSVLFPGFIHREKLANYYALAEVFVLPTHTDTWGLVVNEAMACGLPIICTDVAGCVADLVEDGWNGRLVPARSVEQLSRALEQLARDPETIRVMGENSKKRIVHYSARACAEGIAAAAGSGKANRE
jgi:glycosyltransferase involved in cell wall biosynthesis